MKFLLKILLAPIRLTIWLFVRLFALMTYISSYVFGIASAIIGILAVTVLLTTSVRNGLILLVIAFVVSPIGLPMLAVKIVGLLDRLGGALGELGQN
ncbi:MAG: succinate dehydrogenase [Acidaminococcaceae bacterium]|nr:succinate dehydrogenase [Acidaminococcaceae bacterium]